MGSIWKEIAKAPSILQDIQKWAQDNEIDQKIQQSLQNQTFV